MAREIFSEDGPATTVSERVRAERVRLLFDLGPRSVLANLMVALVCVVWLWSEVSHTALLIWLTGQVLVQAYGVATSRRYYRTAQHESAAAQWEKHAALRCLGSGILWGSLSLLLAPPSRDGAGIFALLLEGAVVAAAAGTLSPSKLCFRAFLLPLALMLLVSLVMSPSRTSVPTLWTLPVFLVLIDRVHDLLNSNLLAVILRRCESEELVREQQVIFDTAAEAIVLIKGVTLAKCNRRFREQLGYGMPELLHLRPWHWFASRGEWRRVAWECLPALKSGSQYRTIAEFRRRDGSLFKAEITARAVSPTDLTQGTVWLAEDISGRIRNEDELRANEQRFRDLAVLSSDWFWELGADHRFTRITGSVLQKMPGLEQACLGRAFHQVEVFRDISDEQWQSFQASLAQHEAFRDFICRAALPGAEPRWLSFSGMPVWDAQGNFAGYHGVGADITERVRNAERLRHMAYHDTLTGLPNRRLLADRLELELARARRHGRPLAMMLFDLDDFKYINDTYGHAVGDQVLTTVASRMKSAIRDIDTLARLGGDEFVLLVPEVDSVENALTVADKMIATVAEPMRLADREHVVGVSIGIALFPNHAASVEALFHRADEAMYDAKRVGGSSYCLALPAAGSAAESRVRH